MQTTLQTSRTATHVHYKFSDNANTIAVPLQYEHIAEQRITDYFAKRSNVLQFSDIAE